jgi:hypothetical protein
MCKLCGDCTVAQAPSITSKVVAVKRLNAIEPSQNRIPSISF